MDFSNHFIADYHCIMIITSVLDKLFFPEQVEIELGYINTKDLFILTNQILDLKSTLNYFPFHK